ncbi:hypothetical protein [Geodermatophilus sp. URMC 65]
MSTATAPAAVERPLPAPGDSSAVRVFLARYGATLLPLLTALVALQLGWQMVTGSTWTAAVTAGWALAVAAWLRCRGWHVGTVLTVTGAPAVLMVALAGPGLSPAGLVLWVPVTTVLAVALAMAALPAGASRARPRLRA